MDELSIKDIPAEKPSSVTFSPLGEMVTPEEVAARLSENLYAQLSDGSDDTVREAITRAGIYIGAVLRRFGIPYNLDDKIIREVVLIHTIYELHIALGHEEAGKEYRIKARDIILAAWGDFPDSDSPTEKSATAAVAVPPKRSKTWR
jgi:hypothetical protein